MAVVSPPCFIPVSAPVGDPQPTAIPALAPLSSANLPDMLAAINGLIGAVNLMSGNVPGSAVDSPLGGGIGGGGGGNSKNRDKKKQPEKKQPQGPTGPHQPEQPAKDNGKWQEDKAKRKTSKVRVYNPDDKQQFIDVERIDSFTMFKQAAFDPLRFKMVFKPPPPITDTFTWKR